MLNSLKILNSISLVSGIYLTSCSNIPTTATDSSPDHQKNTTTQLSQNIPSIEDWENVEVLYTLWGHSKPITNVIPFF